MGNTLSGFAAADLSMDQARIVKDTTRLLQATVDVIASNGWLSPALTAMELSQMVTQGLWDRDPVLMQLPHFNRDLCKKASKFDTNKLNFSQSCQNAACFYGLLSAIVTLENI